MTCVSHTETGRRCTRKATWITWGVNGPHPCCSQHMRMILARAPHRVVTAVSS